MKHEPKRCEICGREYIPRRCDQRCCLDPECTRERQRLNQAEYRKRHYDRVLANNRRTMKERRERKKQEKAQQKDTLIAIGYADRQREQTLQMVGRVKVEL